METDDIDLFDLLSDAQPTPKKVRVPTTKEEIAAVDFKKAFVPNEKNTGYRPKHVDIPVHKVTEILETAGNFPVEFQKAKTKEEITDRDSDAQKQVRDNRLIQADRMRDQANKRIRNERNAIPQAIPHAFARGAAPRMAQTVTDLSEEKE